jgi:hypothetical protein
MKRLLPSPAIAGLLLLCATAAGGCASPTVQISTPTVGGTVLPEAPLLFHLIDGEANFQALVGSLDSEQRAVQVTVNPEGPDIVLGVGWSYMFGRYPRAQGRLVHASATGTTLIFAVYPGYDRVLFLCADDTEGVEVEAQYPVSSGSSRRTLTNHWYYVDATDQNGVITYSASKPVPKPSDPDPDGARALVERVKHAVDQLNLGGWCSQP